MKKAKTNSETKERLIVAAQQLMQTKGFVATSVDEICQTAGLSKGSFFHYFKSKEDIGKAVLDHYSSSIYHLIETEGCFSESDPLKSVYEIIDLYIIVSTNPERQTNSIVGSFAQTLSQTHPEIREICGNHYSWLAGTIKRYLDEAKAKYAPEAVIDTRSLADYFIATFEGSLILAKATLDQGVIQRNLLLYRQHIHDLFEK
ncbi:MAG: TetR/AcrR family transcriptional regulator [Candidatus Aquicultor sp.]